MLCDVIARNLKGFFDRLSDRQIGYRAARGDSSAEAERLELDVGKNHFQL